MDISANFVDADSHALTYTAASAAPTVATLMVIGIAKGETTITVTADDGTGEPNATVSDTFDVTVKLATPTNVAATPGDRQVMLSWDAVAGADSYRVAYKPAGGRFNSVVNTGSTTSHTFSSLTNGQPYTFRVWAHSNAEYWKFNSINVQLDATPTAETLNSDATPSVISLAVVSDNTIDLTPAFAADTIDYTSKVGNSVGQATILYELADGAADAVVTPEDADSVTSGHQVNLPVGDTLVTLTIIAGDEYTTNVYSIMVTRLANTAPVIAAVAALTVEAGSTTTFTVSSTDADNHEVDFTATAEDASVATVAIVQGGGMDASTAVITVNGVAQGSTTITCTATDDGSPPASDAETVALTVPAINAVPTFSAAGVFRVAENTTAVGTVTATGAYAGDSIANYSLGGTDSELFSITSGGVLSFDAAPDYENPQGGGGNSNTYMLTVSATSSRGLTATQSLTVMVIDVNEPPVAPVAPTVTAASSTSLTITWTVPANAGRPVITDYDVQYRIAGSGTFITWSPTGTASPNTITGRPAIPDYDVRRLTGNDGAFVSWSHTGTALTATITGLTAGTPYQVQVRAVNAEGNGDLSPSGTATPAAVAGLTLSTNELMVTEGGTATYTIKLNSQQPATVTVTPTSTNASVATVSTARSDNSLWFTTSNWDINQSVTVTGAQDADTEDDSTMVTRTVSGSGYGSMLVSTVTVNVTDDTPDNTVPIIAAVPEQEVSGGSTRTSPASTTDAGNPPGKDIETAAPTAPAAPNVMPVPPASGEGRNFISPPEVLLLLLLLPAAIIAWLYYRWRRRLEK